MSEHLYKTNVEMSEVSEQLEPLMSTKLPVQQTQKDGCFDISVREPPHGVTLASLSGTAVQDEHSSPTDTEEVMRAGGLSKNLKRPGSTRDSQCITMTGTVKTGNSVGQPVEVQLELTEHEFLRLTSREPQTKVDNKYKCGHNQGPHVVLWSVLCIPVAMVISVFMSFYNGSMTWYNLVIYFKEEKSFIHKVTLCPLLILSFPLTVGLSAFLVAVTASMMQISWSWQWWWAEICDGEKGFYGWFCRKVGLPTCSPYQVVVLNDANT